MVEFPDFHSYKALEKYFSLRESLFTVKEPEQIKSICWTMIEYVPLALKEQQEFNDQHIKALKESHEAIGRHEPDEYYRYVDFVTAEPFKRYAIICEKEGNLPTAIWSCQQAIHFGLTNDGTKGGMTGRLEKLMKKYEEQKA